MLRICESVYKRAEGRSADDCNERTVIKQRQAEGIAAAKAKGQKFGRPASPIPTNFNEICVMWNEKKISGSEAAKMCQMPRSTFYYKAKGKKEA